MSMNNTRSIGSIIYVSGGVEFESTTFNGVNVMKHIETGYYNIGRICSDNGKRYPDISRNLSYIHYLNNLINKAKSSNLLIFESLKKYGPVLDFNEGFRNEVKGTYAHPLLTSYVCSWAIPEYEINANIELYEMSEELQLRNITFENKIDEMKAEIENMKIQLKNANNCMKRVENSIRIDKEGDSYHLFIDYKERIINENTVGSVVLYNANEVLRLMNFYAKNKCVNNIEYKGQNMFQTDQYEKLIKYINDVSDNTLSVKLDYDDMIEKIMNANYKSYIPYLFEIYCSKEYYISPFKFALTESIGLGKKDRGCDLLDIDSKATGQCKYYIANKLGRKKLLTYFEFVRTLDYDENYLFVNDNIKFESDIIIYNSDMEIMENNKLNPKEEYFITIPGSDKKISIMFINNNKFMSFVNEVETKYNLDENRKVNKEVAEYAENLKREMEIKVQQFKNKKAVIASKIAEIKAIEDHKKTIHEAKDDKFEGTNIEEQRKFLKELIKKNPSGIPFEECLRIMNERFNANYNNVSFGHKFSDLYAHRWSNSTYPTINGQRYILPVGSLEDEIDFIRNYIDIKDIPVDEYLELHNKEFGQHYNATSFGHKFGKMFKNDGMCFARKTVDSVRIHVLQLVDTNRNERIIEIVNDLFNKFGELPVPLIVFYLRFKCRILYSSSGFMEEFKNFKYTCARFNNNRREAFDKFVKTFDENLKKIFDEKYKSTISPNFIIG